MRAQIISILILLAASVASAQTLSYSGVTFNMSLNEQDADSLIVENCTFENISEYGIRFRNVDVVVITGCTFKNISGGAIQGKGSGEITIANNTFDSIGYTALRFPFDGSTDASERNRKLTISGNQISNVVNREAETGSGIRVFHCDSVVMLDNVITQCEWAGIQLGRNSSDLHPQRIDYALIHGNTISYTLSDGLSAQENVYNATVSENTISYIAYDGRGGRPSHGDHGMYWQAPDALIVSNTVFNNLDDCESDFGCQGSGISLRTTAEVVRNRVSNCTGVGIGYFNDHPRGEKPLKIINNIVVDNDRRGVYVNGSNSSSRPDSLFVLHNTVVGRKIQELWHHSSPIAINEMSGYNDVSGNIMLYDGHDDPTQSFWKNNGTTIDRFAYNFQATRNVGFKDLTQRDLRLKPNAILIIDKIPEADALVEVDYFGNTRSGDHDIGAEEYISTSNVARSGEVETTLRTFPNPTEDALHVQLEKAHRIRTVRITALNGVAVKEITVDANVDYMTIDVSELPSGAYVVEILSEDLGVATEGFVKL